jgi:ligand-binding sensor domain-containing protein
MSGPDALAFDSSGDLWVGNYESDKLVEYPKVQLSTVSPVPAVVISAGAGNSPNEPASLTFDRSGDLWVANQGPGTVTEYSQAQLTKSGSPAPYKTISYPGLSTPLAVRFDHSGDLWVSYPYNVVEFTKAGLAKADPGPNVVLSPGAALSLSGYGNNIAFDQQGNLWVANESGTLVELTEAQLAHSGAPSPHVTITDLALSQLSGVALDSSGDLWTSEPSNVVVEFTKAQLAKSGSHIPARTVSGPKTGLNSASDIAIAP